MKAGVLQSVSFYPERNKNSASFFCYRDLMASWLTLREDAFLLVDPYLANCCTHRGHVNGCCGFVHDEDAAFADKSSGQTEELPLPHTEVLPSFCDHGICDKTSSCEYHTPEMLPLRALLVHYSTAKQNPHKSQ